MIELHDSFNTKGCPDEIIFVHFCDQTIPPDCYDFLNDDDDDGNNIPVNPVDDLIPLN